LDSLDGERFLVTGAQGCIGSWTVRHLVRAGATVVATDLTDDPVRPRLIMSADELAHVQFGRLDVTQLDELSALVERERITRIIHLAGVLIPGCIANPSLGARVNVEGTVNVLEAVRRSAGRVAGLAYASSIAVLGPAELYRQRPVPDDVPLHPRTLYGVYKVANEHSARLYWESWGIPSVGLRPGVVYGVGRDTGMSSDATKAMLAAVAGRPFQFGFSGALGMQFAPDVAAIFVRSAMASPAGAPALNIRGVETTIHEVVDTLARVVPAASELIEIPPDPRDSTADLSDAGLRALIGDPPDTSLDDGIEQTVTAFRALLGSGAIAVP
jgi:nucleoside-diphosphate-sugar epimerase